MRRRDLLGVAVAASLPAVRGQETPSPKAAARPPVHPIKVVKLFKAPDAHPNALEADPDGLWIGDQVSERVFKVDWKTGEVLHQVQTEAHNTSGLAVGDGHLWIGCNGGVSGRRPPRPNDRDISEVLQADLRTGKTVKWHKLPWGGCHGITYVPQTKTLWATALSVNALAEVDPRDFRVVRLIPVRHARAHGLEWDNGAIWCVFAEERIIQKLDATNGKVLEEIRFSAQEPDPHGLCMHDGRLYTCDAGLTATFAGSAPGYIIRIDWA